MRRSRIVALRTYQVFSHILFDPIQLAHRIVETPAFITNLVKYARRQREADPSFRLSLRYIYPVLGDRHAGAGVAGGHYFHQDIWAARLIHAANPARHVDVGSSVAGFVAHLLTFREVEYVDIRPLRTNVTGLRFVAGDLTRLPFKTGSVESLSALHVVEHVGLGRYGDPLDPAGWRVAIEELKRVLRPGGTLYFSVPVGPERLEFDAHHVFAPSTIVEVFKPLQLSGFAMVNDEGDFVSDVRPESVGGWYSCGLFIFTSSPSPGDGPGT